MEKIPNQVTIRGVLAATFWISLTCAIWANLVREEWNPAPPITFGMDGACRAVYRDRSPIWESKARGRDRTRCHGLGAPAALACFFLTPRQIVPRRHRQLSFCARTPAPYRLGSRKRT
jgi:hypothetical protein